VVDTTVQPKAVAHPTDARLTHRAIIKLVEFAKAHGIVLRQSYLRVAKRAAIMVGRYTDAHQFKRANRELRFLRKRLGRLIRNIGRKVAGNDRFDRALRATALTRRQGPVPTSAPARPEALCATRAGGRMHRQGQGQDALRVRLQGLGRDTGHTTQRRSVRASQQRAARQPALRLLEKCLRYHPFCVDVMLPHSIPGFTPFRAL
jgi:hypothetical protein